MTPEQIRTNITNNVQGHTRAHQHSPAKSLARKLSIWAVVGLLFVASAALLMLFIEQSRVAQIFNPFIGSSLIGYIWMWFPELLLLSLALFGLSLVVIKLSEYNMRGFMQLAALSYGLIIVISLIFTPVTNTVAQSLDFASLSRVDYRLRMRDSYVKVLQDEGEFFGVVSDASCQQEISSISIDHGGIIKELKVARADCETIAQGGPLIWVSYSDNVIQEYRLLD